MEEKPQAGAVEKIPVLTSTRFIVSIDGFESPYDKLNVAAFAQCSGFSYKSKSIIGRFGDDDFYAGGYKIRLGMEYSTITLSKGVITDDRLFNYVTAAQHRYQASGESANLMKDNSLYLTVETTTISGGLVYSDTVTWKFLNAVAVGYELAPFDANRSEVLMESFKFFFWGVERESNVEAIPRDPVI